MTIRVELLCLGCGVPLTTDNTHTKPSGRPYSRCRKCLAEYARLSYQPVPPRPRTERSPRRTGKKRSLGRPWRRLVAEILRRDGYQCQLAYPGTWPGVDGTPRRCLGRATTADHIVPASAGGTDHPDNLRAACQPCNMHRGSKPEPEKRNDQDKHSRSWT